MIGQTTLFPPDVSGKLRNRVDVCLVTTAQARHVLENFHYLHRARVGRQLNYAVMIDGIVDGVITYAYPMMSAAVCGVPSDCLIEFARLYLHRNVPHTASCAIGKTIKRVRADWIASFPESVPPRLCVSWSDTVYHVGTVYKAANFTWLRRTSPGGKQGPRKRRNGRIGLCSRPDHADYKHDKDCWIYWLDKPNRKAA